MKKSFKALLTTALAVGATFAMSAMVYAAPGTVTGLKQTNATTTSFDVTWDALLGVDKYDIEYSTSRTDWTSNVATDYSYSTSDFEVGLSSGKSYYIRVRGVKDSEVGAWSEPLEVVTAPTIPENLIQTGATTSSVTYKWNATPGATGYKVYRNADKVVVASPSTNSTTIANLKPSIKNQFMIYAVRKSSAGFVAQSSSYLYASNYKLIPKAPTGFSATYLYSSLKKADLECDMNYDIDGYQFEIYNNSGKKIKTVTQTSRYVQASNITKQFFKARVRGYVVINNAKKYGAWTGYTYFAQQPDVNLKKSGKNIKVSWAKVKGAKEYEVYVSTSSKSGFKKVATTKGTSYKLSKFKKKALSSKKTYYVYVVAVKKVGKKKYKSFAEKCVYLF